MKWSLAKDWPYMCTNVVHILVCVYGWLIRAPSRFFDLDLSIYTCRQKKRWQQGSSDCRPAVVVPIVDFVRHKFACCWWLSWSHVDFGRHVQLFGRPSSILDAEARKSIRLFIFEKRNFLLILPDKCSFPSTGKVFFFKLRAQNPSFIKMKRQYISYVLLEYFSIAVTICLPFRLFQKKCPCFSWKGGQNGQPSQSMFTCHGWVKLACA
jgi:hypothetical protein